MADTHTLFAQYQERLLRYFGRAVGERGVARDLAQEVSAREFPTYVARARD